MSFLLDADYAAIEARIVNWLAGQEDALDRFRAYDAAKTEEEKYEKDVYRIQAVGIYQIPLEQITKHPHRFVGKQATLLCGFQGGPPKFRSTCKVMGGYDLPLGLEYTAVKAWRQQHKMVVKYWYAVDEAAKNAIIRKGQTFTVRNVKFLCKDIEGMSFLLIRLPSGRKLAYPRPKVVPSRKFENATTINFFGHIKGVLWGDVDTYGGKIVENITQAVAADVMANGVHQTEAKGYETATLIHDQCLSYYCPERGQTVEEFVRLLTDLPSWAAGLPIAAEGALVPFYKKD